MDQGPSPTSCLGFSPTVWSVAAVAGPNDLTSGSEDRPGNVYITCSPSCGMEGLYALAYKDMRIYRAASSYSVVNLGSMYHIDSRVK